MKMTSMNMVPIIAVSTVMMAALAAAKVRSRKWRRSKSGEGMCSSQATKPASSAAAAANRPSTLALVQPQALPWMSASVRQKRPAQLRPTPAQSSGASAATVRRRGMSVSARTTPSAPTGRLNQKIAGQPQRCTRTPPSTGPKAAAAELSAPKRPAANPWRCAGYACIRRAREVGTTAEAPTACTTRKAMSRWIVGAVAQPSEARVNTARPSTKTRLCP